VVAIDPSAADLDVRSPAASHERDRGVVGHLACAATVEVAQHVDRAEQLLAVGVGAQPQR
jgi:hypothetical protein